MNILDACVEIIKTQPLVAVIFIMFFGKEIYYFTNKYLERRFVSRAANGSSNGEAHPTTRTDLVLHEVRSMGKKVNSISDATIIIGTKLDAIKDMNDRDHKEFYDRLNSDALKMTKTEMRLEKLES